MSIQKNDNLPHYVLWFLLWDQFFEEKIAHLKFSLFPWKNAYSIANYGLKLSFFGEIFAQRLLLPEKSLGFW